jgi:hypothetical protein
MWTFYLNNKRDGLTTIIIMKKAYELNQCFFVFCLCLLAFWCTFITIPFLNLTNSVDTQYGTSTN